MINLNSEAHNCVRSILCIRVFWQLYVLELQHGYYYIGITFDVSKRLAEHSAGLGANFTRAHKPIRVVETFSCETDDKDIAQQIENKKTVEYAIKYGGDKVKGGKYFIASKLNRKVRFARGASA